MRDLLVGSTLLASFFGGVVALFAPCCISVMLPAYFATSFRRRAELLSMTFVFSLGVSAIILPIAFGASGVSRAVSGHHTTVFMAGAALMLAMGVATILGWKPRLPMIGMRARNDRGPGAVFALGAFSGIASACCAPVLAGVVALSGASSSFLAALAVGVAYVFGMVLPLFVMALAWDHYDWGNTAWLTGRTVRLAGRHVQLATLVSGLLLIVMGGLTFLLAVSGPSMPSRGWQVTLTARLQHYAHNLTTALSAIPGWVVAMLLIGALARLVWLAVIQRTTAGNDDRDSRDANDDGGDGGEPSVAPARESEHSDDNERATP